MLRRVNKSRKELASAMTIQCLHISRRNNNVPNEGDIVVSSLNKERVELNIPENNSPSNNFSARKSVVSNSETPGVKRNSSTTHRRE